MARSLRHTQTLVYYDGPQLIVGTDSVNTKYLCLLAEQSERQDKFFCVPVSGTRLTEFEQGGLDLLEIYRNPELNELYVGNFDLVADQATLMVTPVEQVPEHWYPEEGFLLTSHEVASSRDPDTPRSLDDLRKFLEAHLGSSWLALREEAWSEWWRGVSVDEAAKRYRQIQTEGNLIRNEWLATREGRSTFAPAGYSQWGNLYSLTFGRKFSAPFFAPQQDESEEEFQKRSAEGRAITAYYQPLFEHQRHDVQREIEEEERRLTAA